jgi:hypothetical protein
MKSYKEGRELSYRVRSVRGKRRRNDKEEYMNIQVGRCAWWKGDNGKGAK